MENIDNKIYHVDVDEEKPVAFALDNNSRKYLLTVSKWAKFLSIVGFVGVGVIFLLGLFMMLGMNFLTNELSRFYTGFPAFFLGFIYFLYSLIYFFPTYYLFLFSKKMKDGLISNDNNAVKDGFKNLSSLFTFVGILTIVNLGLVILALFVIAPILIFAI